MNCNGYDFKTSDTSDRHKRLNKILRSKLYHSVNEGLKFTLGSASVHRDPILNTRPVGLFCIYMVYIFIWFIFICFIWFYGLYLYGLYGYMVYICMIIWFIWFIQLYLYGLNGYMVYIYMVLYCDDTYTYFSPLFLCLICTLLSI